MASKSKNMKKAVSKEDLKRLMKEKQASKDNKTKVTHPLAKYAQYFILVIMQIATIGKLHRCVDLCLFMFIARVICIKKCLGSELFRLK